MGDRFRVEVNFRPPLEARGLADPGVEAGACEEALTEASAKGSSLSIQ